MKRIAHIIAFAFAALSAVGADLVPPLVDNDTKDLAFPTNRALLSTSEKASLTGGGASTDHYHSADRDRSNHTGTQPWSSISGTPTTLAGYGITDGGVGGSSWSKIPTGATVLWTFGDSITAGSSASDRTNRWTTLLAGYLGLTINNVAYGGSVIADINGQILPGFTWTNNPYGDPAISSPSTISTNTLSALLVGFNDMRDNGTNLSKLNAFAGGLAHAIAYLGLPSTSVKSAQSATSSGSWSALTWHGGSLGRQSSSAGATLSFTNLNGDVVYLAYENAGNSTNGGAFSVTIDGVTATATTVTATSGDGNRAYDDNTTSVPYTAGPYGNGRIDCVPTVLRYAGLGPGPHTILVTVTSAATGPVRILWAGTPPEFPPGDNRGPHVYVGDTLSQVTWSINGSDQAAAMYREVIRQIVSRYSADGLKVRLVPTSKTYDRYSMIDADAVHPNDSGHVAIAQTFLHQMQEESNPFAVLAAVQNRSSAFLTELGVTAQRPTTSRYGPPPNWTNSSVNIAYSESALDRHLFLGGNYVRSETKAGTAQNLALAASGANVIVQGGSGYGIQYGSGGPIDTFGSGDPNGVSSLGYGSSWRRTDTGQLYVKKSASGTSTGWVDVTAAGGGSSLVVNGTTYASPIITNTASVTVAANGNGHLEFTASGVGTNGAVSKELRSWSANQFMPPSIGTNAALWAPRGNGIPAVSLPGTSNPRSFGVLLKVPQGHDLTGGLQLVLDACSSTAIATSNVVIQAQYQLLSPGAATVDTASYSGAVLITNTFPGVVGLGTNLTFNLPGWTFTAGQLYQIDISRQVDSASDTNDASAVVVFNAQVNTIN